MGLTFTIDNLAVALILDGEERRPLGTGFCLLRPNWYVTAKHVVLVDGLPRGQLLIGTMQPQSIPATVMFAHPQVDLAVLSAERDVCPHPLFPAHHSFAGGEGLICTGFAPSSPDCTGGKILVNSIPRFSVESRGRGTFTEELVVFDAPYSEGGHSGGPIFGVGGGVVGVIIQNFPGATTLQARGTSLAPLLSHLKIA